jgi:hypothetical protein
MNRRELLQMLGALTGGALLVGPFGCADDVVPGDGTTDGGARPPDGSGGGGDGGGTPNAYRYHSIVAGSAVSIFHDAGSQRLSDTEGKTLPHFLGEPLLADDGTLVYQALDADGKEGLYRLAMDFTKSPPTASTAEKIVAAGDTVDGHTVSTIGAVDMAQNGSIAFIMRLSHDLDDGAKGQYEAVYTYDGTTLKRLISPGVATADQHIFGGVIEDVSITNEAVLVSARYNHMQLSGYHTSSIGLFNVPFTGGETAKLLVSRGDTPAGPNYPISEFGLIDAHTDTWVAHAFFEVPISEAEECIATGSDWSHRGGFCESLVNHYYPTASC